MSDDETGGASMKHRRRALSPRIRAATPKKAPPGIGPFFVAAMFGVSSAGAVTLHVPSEYSSIHAGLDASSLGDTVLVAPGTYSDVVVVEHNGALFTHMGNFKDGVVLMSESGPEATVLDMSGVTIVGGGVYFAGFDLVSESTAIEGFSFVSPPPNVEGITITFSPDGLVGVRNCAFEGFDVRGEGSAGGAMLVTHSNVVVENCRFDACSAYEGGAIWAYESSLWVDDCEFTGCTAVRGGAISTWGTVFLAGHRFEVRRSRFVGNVASSACGAITKNSNSHLSPVIEDCWFERNDAPDGGAVGFLGIELKTVVNCVFVENSAGFGTGALVMSEGVSHVEGNTFYGNSKEPIDFSSGSALSFGGGGCRILNNVFEGNTGRYAVRIQPTTVLEQEGCNVFWDNPDGNVSGFVMDPSDLVADPLFCAPEAGDFTLSATSPCLPGGNGACELIGALEQGCGTVSVERMSWGGIKGLYR